MLVGPVNSAPVSILVEPMTSMSTISFATVHRLQLVGFFDEPNGILNRGGDQNSDTQAGEGHLQ